MEDDSMRIRVCLLLMVILGLGCGMVYAAELPIAQPFESAGWSTPVNVIDAQVVTALGKQGVRLRNPCSDGVFVRRVYLDLIGAMPRPKEVTAFLKDRRPDKRARLIEDLLGRDEFADYWSMKWCDLLRVKSEFPINLWPNAVQAYHHWVRDSIRDNKPYDQFARQLLTSSGSNFRVPPVNFYRAVQGRDPSSIAKTVALTFMGVRFDRWPAARRSQMAAFFSQVAYKKTSEWKEEIVYPNPVWADVKTCFPDGSSVKIPAGTDPREVFADWLVSPKNGWFAQCVVNRIWAWTMGRGIIHEVDDIRPDNPPASLEVLSCLTNELIRSHYDLRSIYRLILNSHTYQQSSIPHNDTANPRVQFAHYTVRQLDAEVLIDALCRIGGEGEGYSSPVPEPFTFIPKDQRTIALADGSITSPFLTTFGRPSRDTGMASERVNQPTDMQRLYMLNSSDIQRRIERSPLLRAVLAGPRGDRSAIVNGVYVVILSRLPTSAESAVAERYLGTPGLAQRAGVNDLAWALINSKEFLFRH
jgi:hypothetical protein